MKNRLYPVLSVLLVAGLTALWVWAAMSKPDPGRIQHLEDGTSFCLRRISLNNTNVFTHGNWIERNLGKVIPKQGINLGSLRLRPRTYASFPDEDTHGLMVEFKRLSTGGPGPQPSKGRAPRQIRCLIVGDDGSVYPAVFSRSGKSVVLPLGPADSQDDVVYHPTFSSDFFKPRATTHSDGDFEYLTATGFPRGSTWLEFRFEKCDTYDSLAKNLPWEPLASFKIKNPFRSKPQPWQATATPATNEIDGLRFLLGGIKVPPLPRFSTNPLDREVTISLQVQSNGVVLPNLRIFSVRMEDALGNFRERGHSYRARDGWLTQTDRLFLDPRQVWKFEAEVAPVSHLNNRQGLDILGSDQNRIITEGLDPVSLCTVRIPLPLSGPYLTNVHNVPLQVTQSGASFVNGQNFLHYQVSVAPGTSGWRVLQLQSAFWQMVENDMPFEPGAKPVVGFSALKGAADFEASFTLVKNYHLEFFVKPTLN